MVDRNSAIDSVKGTMIILVVFGHVIYKGNYYDLFQNIHDFVYIFHMPIFLMLSGYFFRCELTVNWLKMVTSKLALPYFLSFSFYLVSLYYVGLWGGVETSNYVNNFQDVLQAIFVKPFASYWYLHSLISFSLVFYVSNLIGEKLNLKIFTLPVILVLYSIFHYFLWQMNVKFFYWVAGYIWLGYAFHLFLKSYYKGVIDFASLLVLTILFLLIITNNIASYGLLRTLISLAILFVLLILFKHVNCNWLMFVGRNSILIFLFHVYFLNIAKFTSSIFLLFDNTGTLFVLFSLIFSVIGSLLIGLVMDKLHISKYILGTSNAIK
ncbi:acyltransferase [Vibrio cyclitrophicus]|uniref:acyltransferase family protein n=1 Tax=Vibrio cyclitrophicus TaxID=47951 RepID=UPI00148C3C56|nr:acyltransferase [Vibrio cyclitrophicus]NOH45051.1 acyltransferase [Vibrio cyclitrophicus]